MKARNVELCVADYAHSAMKDYSATSKLAGHKYLAATFIPKTMNLLQQLTLGNKSSYQYNFFPLTNNGVVDAASEAALASAVAAKSLPEMYLGRVALEVPPIHMKNSQGAFICNADGSTKVYTSITVVAVCQADGETLLDDNTLLAQADRIVKDRLQKGTWVLASAPQQAEPDPSVITTVLAQSLNLSLKAEV